jgi:predicted dehydrogenase
MIDEPLRVAIAGCGLIGHKRAEALGTDVLVGCFDVAGAAAEGLAQRFGGRACGSLDELVALGPDVVVVSAVHNALADVACVALRAGAHVLVEKPAGVSSADVDRIAEAAAASDRLVKVGFNHRFHPAIARAVEEAQSGEHGDVMFARARYGHGGRLGYESEWRADPLVSGGGEIVDQGMHLLDLSHWLFGPLPLRSALLRTHFWKAPVDDNAVLVLGDSGGVGSSAPWMLIHVSWTEWKNLFSWEIYCRRAKLAIDGLVGSYGPQRLRIYRMRPELGPPDLEEFEFADVDVSWAREWAHFAGAVRGTSSELLGDLDSARYAWRCVEQAQSA